jgi:hypothetical protein
MIHEERRTDMTKVTGVSCDYENAPKISRLNCKIWESYNSLAEVFRDKFYAVPEVLKNRHAFIFGVKLSRDAETPATTYPTTERKILENF